jgi:hypothetical protein
MHLAKLVKVLRAFDKEKLSRFQKYVHSPFFGVFPSSVELLDYFVKIYPNFTEKKVCVTAIKKAKRKLSNDNTQNIAASRLIEHAQHFIAYEAWHQSEHHVTHFQLAGLKGLNLEDEFEKGYEKEMKILCEDEEQSFDTLYHRHMLTEQGLNGFKSKLNRTAANTISPVIETLDVFHALKKLRYLCESFSRNQFFGSDFDGAQIPHLMATLEPLTKAKHPYAYIFVNVFHMLTSETFEDSELYYGLIKDYLSKPGGEIGQTKIEAVNFCLSNCLKWYNKGNTDAAREYLWCIQWKMKNGLLLHNDILQPITFRNIITLAVECYSPQEMARLINEYGKHIHSDHSPTEVAFAWALQHYKSGEYKKAIHQFMQARAKEDPGFNSGIRRWQWMCEYDCDNSDTTTLLNQLEAFEKYLHRHRKELAYAIPTYKQFIHYCEKLVVCSATEASEIRVELEGLEHFAARPWLIEKFSQKERPRGYRMANVKKDLAM